MPKKPGPQPETLKIDLPLAEGLRRLVKAKPKPRLRLVKGKGHKPKP